MKPLIDYFYRFPSNHLYNMPGRCRVRIYKRKNGAHTVLLTELDKLDYLQVLQQDHDKYARPSLEKLLEKWEGNEYSVEVIDKMGAVSSIGGMLRKNEIVGILADQRAGGRGVFVDFFGRKASNS